MFTVGVEGEVRLTGLRPTLWQGRLYNAGPLAIRRYYTLAPCWRKTMSPRADWLLFSFPPLGARLTSVAEYQAADRMIQSGWLEGKKRSPETGSNI